MKILICFGTRPEAIKMAPVIKAFKKNDFFHIKVCVTAQHREMLDQVLDFFQIIPDIDLNLMQADQSLNQLSARIIKAMDEVLEEEQPDWVLVHGDTTTSTMVALAAFHRGIKIGHVEAGLRTYDKYSPFPEEINRQLTGRIANAHFAPTPKANDYLLKEGVQKNEVILTGNTVVDALHWGLEITRVNPSEELHKLLSRLDKNKKLILVTGHRRENFGQGFINICESLAQIATRNDVELVYPVHLNPHVKDVVHQKLGKYSNIHLIPPVDYPVMLGLLEACNLIISDSGGIQEEAPSLGKMVLVTRATSERMEGIEKGYAELVGTDTHKISEKTNHYLDHPKVLKREINPYGSGNASEQIVNYLLKIKTS
ncbi:UDP-N-acetylglucosamine 2-epimerase (non-hydrolyzing) [Psychroflexus sp. CAK57W]|uniref:non-hydrolyzing UDP-N-acetylglucosamine 2-epimerase n=1 Tax=Psychroflexus curvus TaxID=2873595 RepID=UPI001CCD6544|nr:UDP-N-acetylglucosamine 2-epimerase (non-hydrolyzing) [Psychroflexus curvus]MBZ9628907.1 UDP-N-acetylglucosamine 2-epimerase (non-hydrolyzing) [Psychroflexus curvus]MBZ9787842.1 UDP-N-acetylglucosamine 2-epimerase (non-hydrolyzing) [Psychroflexus curvus]